MTDCPRGPGAADLFARLHLSAEARLCLTARFDPDRIRLDAALRIAGVRPADWLAAGADPFLGRAGADAEMGLQIALGRAARARLEARLRARGAADLVTLLDGTFGAAIGAARGRWLIEAGVTDEARATKQIATAIRGLQADAVKVEPADGGWSVIARKPAKLPVDRGWLGVRGARVMALTGAPPWPEGDPRGRADFGLDPALLRAPAALFMRPAGEPHGGAVYADAVLAALTPLGVDGEAIRRLASALAFAWGHLGELGLAVRPEGDAFVLGLEMVTL